MAERLVVIGGDAAGMSAATQARRGRPDLEIVALEKGRWTSYSACGIPYVVGGDVGDLEELVVRTPEQHRANGIDVRVRHEATTIDLDAREVEVRDHEDARTYRVGFDHLLVATGAVPRRPPIPGIDDPDVHVHGVQTLDDAAALLDDARDGDVDRVVVVGGGYVGLELAEAFVNRGRHVTVVEAGPEVMSTLDSDMGAHVSAAMRRHGIDVRCGEAVTAFEPGRVHTESGSLPADLVVLGLGVDASSRLARDAGVPTGARDAIVVDTRQRTPVDGVWAAGDCCESFHLVSRRQVHVALGTVANKQGRVAGTNIGGGDATFPGVVGTAATKLCGTEIARTGLNEREATDAGLEHHAVTIESRTRAGYFPGSAAVTVKVLAEKSTARLLGAQIVGGDGAAKRIDVFATALTAGMGVDQVAQLDLSYARRSPRSGTPCWSPPGRPGRSWKRAADRRRAALAPFTQRQQSRYCRETVCRHPVPNSDRRWDLGHGRHRMGAGLGRTRALHDAGTGVLLRRDGAFEERPRHAHAELLLHGAGERPVGARRVQSRLR